MVKPTSLMHQVVIVWLAAVQVNDAIKTTVRGGGRLYRRRVVARQVRPVPEIAVVVIAHGPQPRDYSQRTPRWLLLRARLTA